MRLSLLKAPTLVLALIGILVSSAQAQISKTPSAQQAIREMGHAFNGQVARKTRAIYMPLQKASPEGPGPVSRQRGVMGGPRFCSSFMAAASAAGIRAGAD